MTPTQSRMARAALKWSINQLGDAAGVARMTVIRFERGDSVVQENVAAMRQALEAQRIKFVDNGTLAGAVQAGLKPRS